MESLSRLFHKGLNLRYQNNEDVKNKKIDRNVGLMLFLRWRVIRPYSSLLLACRNNG